MYVLPKKDHDKNMKNFKNLNLQIRYLKNLRVNSSGLKSIMVRINFTQNILHGNVINKENTSRWSFNCRFKSLLSPYEGAKQLEIFLYPLL